jgi:hypothetical protein
MSKHFVKYFVSGLCVLLCALSEAQIISLPEGEFMDTTHTLNRKCEDLNIYYYQIQAKYPISSDTLAKEAQAFLEITGRTFLGSGYITFRRNMDCEGKPMKRVRVFQTDQEYQNYHFEDALVKILYAHFESLKQWKPATYGARKFYYTAYISYKIKNGKVTAVIP